MDIKKSSFHILPDSGSEDVLYSNDYFTVTKTELIIKCYYFPTCSSKVISLKTIISIHTDKELGFKWYERKMWGQPIINVWYAMDWKRHCKDHTSCIIEVKDDKLRKGFTIDENGLEILKQAWNDALNSVIS
ncbi:hypothetical protein C1645_758598 [Glomus cerebriforme]|uniref:GRAM domain-containing protein n=1 Tax=Glomus cerebriforme TaxID=658196 RepID=A0A397T9S3_9GLOM|nr:hypothetical protein C1645_758598 [Glomus cerebriforme]